MDKFKRDEKVFFQDEVYDFGYISGTGHAIIYEEGERNMQDAFAVDPNKLKKIPVPIVLKTTKPDIKGNDMLYSMVYNPITDGRLQSYIDNPRYTVKFGKDE